MSIAGLQRLQEELNQMGLANFEIGASESINSELPVDEQADLLHMTEHGNSLRKNLFLV